jgi:hypothetical protein
MRGALAFTKFHQNRSRGRHFAAREPVRGKSAHRDVRRVYEGERKTEGMRPGLNSLTTILKKVQRQWFKTHSQSPLEVPS